VDVGAAAGHRVIRTALPFALVLALWQAACTGGLAPASVLPTPAGVGYALQKLIAGGEIFADLAATLLRCFAGLLASFLLGVPLGALMATSPRINGFFTPLIRATYALPKTALVPLFILWFGVGLRTEVGAILLSALLPLTIYTYQGVKSVPRVVVWSAAAMGTPRHALLWHILLPASLQASLAGLRIALGFTFVSGISTEMIAANSGIGRLIFQYGESGAYDYMFAAVLTLVSLVFLADAALVRLSNHLLRWHG
jgi:NitT/TauT family transport system permease protein